MPCTLLRVGLNLFNRVSFVRILCIYIDADWSWCTNVLKTTVSCFAAVWQLWTICPCLPSAAYKSLIVSLVLSWLDYGNVMLSGLPDYNIITVGDHSFPVAGMQTWNNLLATVHSASSLSSFKDSWKLFIFASLFLTYSILTCHSDHHLS